MHALLQSLHRDHVNFARLLRLAAAELAACEQGGDPDYRLLEDAISYIEQYADRLHHPREDVIYELLRERYPAHAALVERLHEEHRGLREATLDAQARVGDALNDAFVDRGSVHGPIAAFIERQFAHLAREEAEVFPLLAATFSSADWSEVGQRLPPGEDPLFGERVRAQYRALYERLVA